MLRFHSKRTEVEKIEIQKSQAVRMVPGQVFDPTSHLECASSESYFSVANMMFVS